MSIMLEADEVDDGYFTPVTSTTLASIFREETSNDVVVNASLKYKPPQLKKTEESSKPDDSSTSQCVYSSSVIAYEWVQGTHKCKGKVGFAVMKIVKTGMCKMILYSPDKSTLSCTTVTPQLEVTMSSGAMISFYDDHKQFWGLCFNDKNIEGVIELLKRENVVIKPYINPDFKPEIEIADSDEATDETASSSTTDDGITTLTTSQIHKASILNRIANVGHAILPSFPGSPKKSTLQEITSAPVINSSAEKLNVISDVSKNIGQNNTTMQDPTKSIAIQTVINSSAEKLNVISDVSKNIGQNNTTMQDPTKSIAIHTGHQNSETNNLFLKKMGCSQTSVSTLPLLNNQIFTYVNGYMVPLHMQVPVLESFSGPDPGTEIELIIQKLNNLKTIIRTMETKQLQNTAMFQGDQVLQSISKLEQSIKEKDETIRHLENMKKDLCDRVDYLNEKLQKTTQDLENTKTFLDNEKHLNLNRKVKTLMNNTFHSLASNFDDEANYTGNYVKGILASVIKKITIESLVNLFPNDASISTKGDN